MKYFVTNNPNSYSNYMDEWFNKVMDNFKNKSSQNSKILWNSELILENLKEEPEDYISEDDLIL